MTLRNLVFIFSYVPATIMENRKRNDNNKNVLIAGRVGRF